jgi:hypothetical protein
LLGWSSFFYFLSVKHFLLDLSNLAIIMLFKIFTLISVLFFYPHRLSPLARLFAAWRFFLLRNADMLGKYFVFVPHRLYSGITNALLPAQTTPRVLCQPLDWTPIRSLAYPSLSQVFLTPPPSTRQKPPKQALPPTAAKNAGPMK